MKGFEIKINSDVFQIGADSGTILNLSLFIMMMGEW